MSERFLRSFFSHPYEAASFFRLLDPRGWMSGASGYLLLVVAVALSGCSDRNGAFIQGDWFFGAPGTAGVTEQTSVYTYWSFDSGDVIARSCCKDLPAMSGHYRIVESSEDTLDLALFDVVGVDFADGYPVRIVINRSEEVVSIQGVGPFERMP